MKKFLLSILFACVIFVANGQSSIGLRGGVNLGKMRIFGEPASFKPLLSISVPVRFDLSEKWTFQPELAYIQKGGYNTHFSAVLNQEVRTGRTANTLNIPMLFMYNIYQNQKIGIDVFIGPSIGYTYDAIIKDNTSRTYSNFINSSYDYEDAVDYEGIIGADVRFKIADHDFVLDIRYSYEWTEHVYQTLESFQHEGISFSLGYIYPLN